MMPYLNWDKLDNYCVGNQIAAEIDGNPFCTRRGMDEIWRAAENDF